jgi:uncharacterized phiE125 gp8 family phage protein
MGVVTAEASVLPVALAELKAFLRISVSDEDALLAGLVRAAADLCEAFTGRALIDRAVEEVVAASTARTPLGAGPVRTIESVIAIDAAGGEAPLGTDACRTEIELDGTGWVQLRGGTEAEKLRVAYRAGMAADWNGVPEMLRHGIVRLAAQYHVHRDQTGSVVLPAAVTALWRPWRRLPFGSARMAI